MTVLVKKSICFDCIWRSSCGSFKKIDEMRDDRNNVGHPNTIFEVIIVRCSMKDYDRSYRTSKNNGMYYCTQCDSMHHSGRIGKLHKVR